MYMTAKNRHLCLRCGTAHDTGIDAALCCATEAEAANIIEAAGLDPSCVYPR